LDSLWGVSRAWRGSTLCGGSGHLLKHLGHRSSATDKVLVVGVDVCEFDGDEVLDHLTRWDLALGQEVVCDLHNLFAQRLESHQLFDLEVSNDALQLVVHKLDALQRWFLQSRDLAAHQHLERRLGHKQRCSRTLFHDV